MNVGPIAPTPLLHFPLLTPVPSSNSHILSCSFTLQMTCIPYWVFWTWITRLQVPKKLLHTVRAAEDMRWAERRIWRGGRGNNWERPDCQHDARSVASPVSWPLKVSRSNKTHITLFHHLPTLCQETLAGHKNVKGVCASFGVYEGRRQVSSRSWRVNGVGEMRMNTEGTCFLRDSGGGPLPVLPGGTLFLSFLVEALFLFFLGGTLFLSFLVGTLFLFFQSLGVTPSWKNLKAWRTW